MDMNRMDRNGMDRNRMDRNGMDRNGMDRNGIGRNGIGRNGMNRNGINWNGVDRNGIGRNGRVGTVERTVKTKKMASPKPSATTSLVVTEVKGQRVNRFPTLNSVVWLSNWRCRARWCDKLPAVRRPQ